MPKVEKQSGYTFFYESQQIDIKQKVSLNVKNETINKTIAALLKGTNVKFEIDATHIILYTGKNNKAISGQPQNISGTVIDESGGTDYRSKCHGGRNQYWCHYRS